MNGTSNILLIRGFCWRQGWDASSNMKDLKVLRVPICKLV